MSASSQQFHLQLVANRPRVHFILQGKGGVGKSLVSSLVAQYLRSTDTTVRCIDTDPVNDTLTQYDALQAEHLNLMREGRVDEGAFDDLMERLLSEQCSFVVDSGATSFVALTNYLEENRAFEILRELGREVLVHSIITGGQASRDTIVGFKVIAERSEPASVVVWLNEFFGPIETESEVAGKSVRKGFREMKVYEDHKAAVLGIVTLARRNPDTFGRDIQQMSAQKLTFNEVRDSARWSLMSKCRIAAIERDLYSQLQAVLA